MKAPTLFSTSKAIVALLFICATLSKLPAQISDIATDVTDPFNMGDTEPSIAVNPLNPLEIAVVAFSEPWSPGAGSPVWKSNNGGLTWTKEFIIPEPGAGLAGPNDQKIQFDQNGNLTIAELGVRGVSPNQTLECYIYRQTGTDTDPLARGALYGWDQPMLDIDRNPGSAFLGRAYSAWRLTSPDIANVIRTADLGITANNVVVGNAAFPNRTARTAIGPDGSAYVVFKTREGIINANFENARFIVKRSDDGGVNWNALGANGVSVHGAGQVQTWFAQNWGNTAKGKVGRARSSDTWIASDPEDGDIYVVYCDQDASGFGQIFVTRSTNRGATWGPSVRLTDGTHHSAFPEIAVTCNGTVGVLYIDFDDAGANTIFRHRFARSFDDGATWTNENLQSMDPGPITNAVSTFLWGDYEGLTAQGGLFYGVFTGESIGRTTLQLDPIFFRRQAWQAPITITCPTVPPVNADPNKCTATVNFPAPTVAGDACAILTVTQTGGLPSGATFPVGPTINTFRVTDAANVSTSCQFTVTVLDNQAPSITCPPNVTVSCEASIKPEDVGTATATDNCSVLLSHTDVIVPGSCTHEFTVNRTWTAKDPAGNSKTCLHVIKVEDKKPPVITCPANITVTCDTTAAQTGMATATDNCDLSVSISRRNIHISGDCEWFCITHREWTATDDCRNTSKCVQVITKDVTPLIEQALSSGPLQWGQTAATVTLPPGKGNCVVKWLPYSGTVPKALKFDDAVAGASCTLMSNPLDGSGHIVNPLLGEAMKLKILVRLNPALGMKKLKDDLHCDMHFIVRQNLADGENSTVNELLRVTDLTLGNINVSLLVPANCLELLKVLKCVNAGRSVCNP
ncbi:MAG: HYR domain-containing protein [Phycisphaerae bacterium]|nr:HYR domain-containing protein [Saprospiraceae bacterium]